MRRPSFAQQKDGHQASSEEAEKVAKEQFPFLNWKSLRKILVQIANYRADTGEVTKPDICNRHKLFIGRRMCRRRSVMTTMTRLRGIRVLHLRDSKRQLISGLVKQRSSLFDMLSKLESADIL